MRNSSFVEYRSPRSPSERRALRERGTLRCWWCNTRTEVRPGFRWGQVSLFEWREYVAEHQPFFCSRPNCVAHRRECGAAAQRRQKR
jgi:hypothetical protein